MKKYVILATCSLLFFLTPLIACTTFLINKNGELVFGRNYDWVSGVGILCTNLKGLEKTSLKREDGNTITWVSKYGSISFNQFGKEFPTGGMNEKGLVVELMWLDETSYPKQDSRPALGVLQWIQYQLDNNATIDEVIATDEKIRISEHNAPLHYLIADASGNAATIEFLNGKMVVHKGKELPFAVLTNNTYSQSSKAANEVNIPSGNKKFSFADNSLQRFTQACSMVQQYGQNEISKPAVDFAFDILGKVAQGDYTKWSIVYDIKNKKIYFKTSQHKGIKSISFSSFDFSCTAGSKIANMNVPMIGAIDNYLKPFDEATNNIILQQAVEESRARIEISDKTKEAALSYIKTIKCK